MFEVGDIVECIDDKNLAEDYPKIIKGTRYVVSEVGTCSFCQRPFVSIGIPIPSHTNLCHHPFKTMPYRPSRFRKIEPEYKVVEVSEEINKQVKELILS